MTPGALRVSIVAVIINYLHSNIARGSPVGTKHRPNILLFGSKYINSHSVQICTLKSDKDISRDP